MYHSYLVHSHFVCYDRHINNLNNITKSPFVLLLYIIVKNKDILDIYRFK